MDVFGFLQDRFTVYVMSLGVFSGLVSAVFLSPFLKNEDYPIESKIAKYGGTAYIVGSITLFLLGLFFGG